MPKLLFIQTRWNAALLSLLKESVMRAGQMNSLSAFVKVCVFFVRRDRPAAASSSSFSPLSSLCINIKSGALSQSQWSALQFISSRQWPPSHLIYQRLRCDTSVGWSRNESKFYRNHWNGPAVAPVTLPSCSFPLLHESRRRFVPLTKMFSLTLDNVCAIYCKSAHSRLANN